MKLLINKKNPEIFFYSIVIVGLVIINLYPAASNFGYFLVGVGFSTSTFVRIAKKHERERMISAELVKSDADSIEFNLGGRICVMPRECKIYHDSCTNSDLYAITLIVKKS